MNKKPPLSSNSFAEKPIKLILFLFCLFIFTSNRYKKSTAKLMTVLSLLGIFYVLVKRSNIKNREDAFACDNHGKIFFIDQTIGMGELSSAINEDRSIDHLFENGNLTFTESNEWVFKPYA